jgi:hypothetical protein
MYKLKSDDALGLLLLIRRLSSMGVRAAPLNLIKEASTESQYNVATTERLIRGQNRTIEGVITLGRP